MRLALSILLVALAYTATAVPIKESDITYPRYIQFAGSDGVLYDVDLEDEVDEELLDGIAQSNIYLLFTRQNSENAQTLVINDAASIRTSYFNPRVPTVVIVHGWLGNQNTGINERIRNAYLGKDETNVIVLDWSRLARANYITAFRGVPEVGRGLGQFVRYLIDITGARYEDIHLVGFSLGAHLVGNAGRELEGRVARVTGLDPAGPLWNLNSNRLSSGDARYVEAIHTNGATVSIDGTIGIGLGIGLPIADADFFPNGGSSQSGCITPICSHNRAWELFASSVSYNHLIGRKCTNIIQIALNFCRGDEFPMGNDDLTKQGEGRYHLSTGWRYPY